MEDKLIGEIPKSSIDKIRVNTQVYNGKPYVNIRVWVQDDTDRTKWHPTKKGLCIAPDMVRPIIELLQKVDAIEPGDDKKEEVPF